MNVTGLIIWLAIGAVAGWVAGLLVKGGGFGLVPNIVVGIIGAVIGGWLSSALGFSSGGGILGSIITSVIGAVVLLVVIQLFNKKKA